MFWGYDVFAKLDYISVGKWVREAENSRLKMKRVEQKDSYKKVSKLISHIFFKKSDYIPPFPPVT